MYMNSIQGNTHDEIKIVPESEEHLSSKEQACREYVGRKEI